MKVTALIPVLNEDEGLLLRLVGELNKFCDQVAVCDKPGLGPAYLHGWGFIPDEHWVLHIDAGGSHDPMDAMFMIDFAHTHPDVDLIIGTRFGFGGEHLGTVRRQLMSRCTAGAMNLITGARYTDWTSGFRLYSPNARKFLAAEPFTTQGHAWQIESLHKLHEIGADILEMPICYRPSSSHLSYGRMREAVELMWRLA